MKRIVPGFLILLLSCFYCANSYGQIIAYHAIHAPFGNPGFELHSENGPHKDDEFYGWNKESGEMWIEHSEVLVGNSSVKVPKQKKDQVKCYSTITGLTQGELYSLTFFFKQKHVDDQLLLNLYVINEWDSDTLGSFSGTGQEYFVQYAVKFVATDSVLRLELFSDKPGQAFFLDEFELETTVLPIELLQFEVKLENDMAFINWSTGMEINNAYFTIERSSAANHWNEIGQIEGAVHSTTIRYYQFIDRHPRYGSSYYRLKQTDFDGRYRYYSMKKIERCTVEEADLKVFPNPTDHKVTIEGSSFDKDRFALVNSLGIDVTAHLDEPQPTESGYVLDLYALHAGFYYLKTESEIVTLIKR